MISRFIREEELVAAKLGKRLDQTIAIGLVIAVVFTALAHGAVEPWSEAVFELLIVTLLLLWGVKTFADRRLTIHIPTVAWPMLGLVLLGLAQSVAINTPGQRLSLSMDTEATRLVVLLLFCLVIACVIAASFLAGRERLNTLVNFLVIYGLGLAVFGLIQHFSWNGKLYWVRPITVLASSPFGPFVNHNHFAGYMEMLVPIPVALIVAGAVRAEARLFYGFAAAMMGVATVVSLSRGGIVSLLAGMLFILVMSFRLRSRSKERDRDVGAARNLTSVAAVGVIIAVILAGVFWIGVDPVIDRVTKGQPAGAGTQAESFHSSRGWIWRDTLRMISAHPVSGVGIGAYQTVYPNYSRADGTLIVDKAHNDYLHLLAEGGIIGGVLALWFAFVIFRAVARWLRSRDPLMAAVALGSGAGIFAMLVHSLFDFNLQLPSNSLLFLLLAATASQVSFAAETARESVRATDAAVGVRSGAADLATGVSS